VSPSLAAFVFRVGRGVCFEAEFSYDDGVADGGVLDELRDFADMCEDGGAGEIGVGWEGVVLVCVEDEGWCCEGVGVWSIGERRVGRPVGGAPEGIWEGC
jgi:hypothetical protein